MSKSFVEVASLVNPNKINKLVLFTKTAIYPMWLLVLSFAVMDARLPAW
jgi:hypothetical protein